MFRLLRFLTSLLAICSPVNPLQFVESDEFDANVALHQHGINFIPLPTTLMYSLGERSNDTACNIACLYLVWQFGEPKVFQPGDTGYGTFNKGYWSTTQYSHPKCVFEPSCSSEVATAVLISRSTGCQFAVKSGGHAPFAGASSITNGFTISLENMEHIVLSEERDIVSIDSGNSWGRVYAELGQYNLTVIGGRVADVGVGGLTLGGGISYFSGEHGWACDNVARYEVVTANGSVLIASEIENADLYFALRGGGNNFGIVTRFDLYTYPLPGGKIWGGTKIYTDTEIPAVTEAFTEFANNCEKEPAASGWLACVVSNNESVMAFTRWDKAYSHDNKSFHEFAMIPSVVDDAKIQPLTNFTESFSAMTPSGFRQFFSVMTFQNDKRLNSYAIDIIFEALRNLAKLPGISAAMTLHIVSVSTIQHMSKRGGNPLGLDPKNGPLIILLINPEADTEAYDENINVITTGVLQNIQAMAKRLGLSSDYLYMNYASQDQNVIASYGEANQQRLGEIARKYDPSRVFQILCPGYHKLE